MPLTPGGDIVGREEELAVLESFLDDATGLPAAVLIEGQPGIGKTTVWRAAIEAARARSLAVLACAPAGSETDLSFAGLRDQIGAAFGELADALPAPQRRALAVALLLEEPEGESAGPGAVAAAFLSVLRLLARDRPVVLAVDDLQWLDAATSAVLEFAVRRLVPGERVALVLAHRVGGARPAIEVERLLPAGRVSRLPLGPLSMGAIHNLVHARLGVIFPRPVLRRLHEASGGNPFFALEVGRALERRGGRLVAGERLPIPERLSDLVSERLAALPAPTRKALGVAASLSEATPVLVLAAMRSGSAVLDPAVDAGVIELADEAIRFTHPLLASAAYEGVSSGARREIHRRLAELVRDPEECARHVALGATPPDPVVAEALHHAARLARARGAPAAAAELAEQALRFTPREPADLRVRRTLDAAAHHFEAGDAGRARVLLEEAAERSTGPLRAEVVTRLARAHGFAADLRAAAAMYREAVAAADEDDPVRAEAEEGLAVAMMRMLDDLPAALAHARSAAAAAERRGDMAMGAEYLATVGLIEGLLGRPGAHERMRGAVELGRFGGADVPSDSAFLRGIWGPEFMSGVLFAFTDDLTRARTAIDASLRRAVELGDESSLPLVQRYAAYVELLAGRWPEAARLADEGYEAAVQTGQPSQQAVLAATRALVAAHEGRVEDARAGAAEAAELARRTGAMFARLMAVSALGLLALSLDDAEEAASLLGPLGDEVEGAGVAEPGVLRFVPDHVESLVALGRTSEAAGVLESWQTRATALGRVSALATGARCHGLLLAARGETAGALAAFQLALQQHERVPMPFDRARTLLCLGAAQRRAKQRAAARVALERALASFDELGARLWAGKARAELARVSGRRPSDGKLTATERRVAALAAEGRATKEIAATLFVSTKTVEAHLSRIYAKLGVRSRTQLARSFGREQSAPP